MTIDQLRVLNKETESDLGGSGRVGPGQQSTRWRGVDAATLLTWHLLTSSDDVMDDIRRSWWSSSKRGWHVWFPLACAREARNQGGACRHVLERITIELLGFCRSAGCEADRAACISINLPRNREFWHHVGRFWSRWRRVLVREAAVGGQVPGFWSGRLWSTSMVLVSPSEAWICTDLIS